jgi:alkylated DNA repair dioxygenase AlkB/serine/threonine protein kinase
MYNKMITITNNNYIPFKDVPSPTDPEETPDVVFYPDLFSGEIADIMFKKLSELQYRTTQYCIANKLTTSPCKMIWLADDPERTYVLSPNNMFGMESTNFPTFIQCIQLGVQQITGKKFNACLLNMYERGQDNIAWDDNAWLGDEFIVPSISFGNVRHFQLRNKEHHAKKFVIRTENGSMIVLRESAQQYWEHNVPRESGDLGPRFDLTFRNIHPNLVNMMPKAKTIRAEKKIVHPYLPSDLYKVPTPSTPITTLSDDKPLNQVYLSNKQRTALITQIKAAMVGAVEGHGNQCVNGSQPELLKKLELKKLLGRGSFGNVYAGCAPAPCEPNAYQFAVKLATMTKADFKFPYATNKQPWHEVYILRHIINPLVENGVSPNLPLLAESYTCSDCVMEFYGTKKGGLFGKAPLELLNENSHCLILLMELATGGDMPNWFESDPGEEELYSALFQMMVGVHTIQTHGQVLNNDVKAPNTLIYDVKPGGYWHYVIHGQDFYVPNYGKLFILNDFGVSRVYSPNHKLVQQRKDQWANLGKRFAMIINGKYSPLQAKKSFLLTKNTKPQHISWGYQDDKKNGRTRFIETAKSMGGAAQISYKKDTIRDPEIEFTPEQVAELNRLGIPADSSVKEFYEHPEVIPPLELVSDTQDVILTFTGGKRATQPGNHIFTSVPNNILEKLQPYVIKNYNPYKNTIDNNPSKGIAGYFLVDFFSKHKNYTQLPEGGKVLGTYRIS